MRRTFALVATSTSLLFALACGSAGGSDVGSGDGASGASGAGIGAAGTGGTSSA